MSSIPESGTRRLVRELVDFLRSYKKKMDKNYKSSQDRQAYNKNVNIYNKVLEVLKELNDELRDNEKVLDGEPVGPLDISELLKLEIEKIEV